MKKILILALAASVSAPALAQHEGHTMPAPPKEETKPAEPAADPHAGHVMPAPAAAPAADPHAGHVMPAPPTPMPMPSPSPAADPHAGHVMPVPAPAPAADPHAGHAMPPASTPPAGDPHAGHDMSAMAEQRPAPPVAPPPPGALSGPDHAADSLFGQEAMAEAREELRREHGSIVTSKILIDQLEARIRSGRDGYFLNAEAWYGGDINKLWLKTEIEGDFGRKPEQAEVQALYSRAIDPWWNLQAGVRYDLRPDPERAYLVLGIEGLAPYWLEVDAAAIVSNKGDVSARFEVESDLRLTQKLILQPRIELDLAAQDVPEIGIGSGLSTAELGLRLRYEIKREFAPYVGVAYERAFGDTADFRRAVGERRGGWNLLLGVRAWF
ncbi:MAG TPA: copper resistance protein B [Allosphingosinicella sp.]|nr:copper resistance protein B [Allosphingosinicella sp.]